MKLNRTLGKIFGAMSLVLLLASPAMADDLASAANAACENMKRCVMESLGPMMKDLPPEQQQMMMGQLENSCTGIRESYKQTPEGHPLEQSATVCMRSMANLSCEEFNSINSNTPECQEYQEKASSYGYGPPQ